MDGSDIQSISVSCPVCCKKLRLVANFFERQRQVARMLHDQLVSMLAKEAENSLKKFSRKTAPISPIEKSFANTYDKNGAEEVEFLFEADRER